MNSESKHTADFRVVEKHTEVNSERNYFSLAYIYFSIFTLNPYTHTQAGRQAAANTSNH